jgi:hypothetical protein
MMIKVQNNTRIVMLVILILMIVISSCAQSPDIEAQFVEPEEQVVVITQIATQIVIPTNPPSTPTPIPTSTPSIEYVSSGGFDPFSAEIYYPLTGCSASRLHIGDTAYIAHSGGLVGLYKNKGLAFEPNLNYPELGSEVEIIDGPSCNEGWIYWKVAMPNTQADNYEVGYYPEGNGSDYFLLPLVINPKPTMDLFSQMTSKYLKFNYYGCGGNRK